MVALVAALSVPAFANSIYWEDGDGASGTITSAGWNDLQTAVDLAQAKAKTEADGVTRSRGKVHVEGASYQRAAGDSTVGDLLIREKTSYNPGPGPVDVNLPAVDLKGGYDVTFTTQGAKTTLDVNGAASANNQYRVLQVSAPATLVDNFTVTKGKPSKALGGGIYVSSTGDNATLQNLTVTNNYTYGSYGSADGGGIALNKANGVRVSSCEITGNKANDTGGGIYVANSGSNSAPVIVEHSTISGNSTVKTNYNYSGNSGGGVCVVQSGTTTPASRVLIANCEIEGNQSRLGSGVFFSSWHTATRLVVFGSTITGNYWNTPTAYKGQGNAIHAGVRANIIVANSTVADNAHPTVPGQYGVFAQYGSWGGAGRIVFVNSVLSDNDNGMYDLRYRSGSGAGSAYTDLQNSTVNEANYYERDDTEGNVNSTTFLAALTAGLPTNAYHSRDATGALSSLIEQNLEGDPSFVDGVDPDPYQLTPGSSLALNNGLTFDDAGGFTYVDANYDGNYDALYDIIVAGTVPAGNHFVYMTDLLGNPRLVGVIDRGAYEQGVPPIPEPAGLALMLLGLPLLGRRRRKGRSCIMRMWTVGLLVTGLAVAFALPGYADEIKWDDGDGGSGSYSGVNFTWDNMQAAITSAEGGGSGGTVKVSGNLTRPAGDAATGDLNVAAGNLAISGGWDAAFANQDLVNKSVLNVNGKFTGANSGYDANNSFRVMKVDASNTTVHNFEITGGRTEGNSGAGVSGNGTGVYVTSKGNNTTLQNLTVTGNLMSTQGYRPGKGGGGIAVTGGSQTTELTGVKITHCEVSNNRAMERGGGIYAANAGTSASPMIVEYCDVTGNSVSGETYRPYARGGGIALGSGDYDNDHYVLIANTKITENLASQGGGIYNNTFEDECRVIVVNSLIEGNREKTSSVGGAGGIWGPTGGRTYIVNSNVVDNIKDGDTTKTGIEARRYSWRGSDGRLVFINSLTADNNGMLVDADPSGGGAQEAHIDFRNTTVDEVVFYQYNQATPPDATSPTLAGALLFPPPGTVAAKFHSIDAAGVIVQTMQANIDGDITLAVNMLDKGLTGAGAGYTYVDVNHDGNYDALLDVIVAGTPPAGSHFAYLTDLAGAQRLVGSEIDRGAHELAAAPIPEPAGLALMLLGLPLLRRRRS